MFITFFKLRKWYHIAQSVSSIWYENGINYLKKRIQESYAYIKTMEALFYSKCGFWDNVLSLSYTTKIMLEHTFIMFLWFLMFLATTVWKLSFYVVWICGRVIRRKLKLKHSFLFKFSENCEEKIAVDYLINQWTFPCECGDGWVGVVRYLWVWVCGYRMQHSEYPKTVTF